MKKIPRIASPKMGRVKQFMRAGAIAGALAFSHGGALPQVNIESPTKVRMEQSLSKNAFDALYRHVVKTQPQLRDDPLATWRTLEKVANDAAWKKAHPEGTRVMRHVSLTTYQYPTSPIIVRENKTGVDYLDLPLLAELDRKKGDGKIAAQQLHTLQGVQNVLLPSARKEYLNLAKRYLSAMKGGMSEYSQIGPEITKNVALQGLQSEVDKILNEPDPEYQKQYQQPNQYQSIYALKVSQNEKALKKWHDEGADPKKKPPLYWPINEHEQPLPLDWKTCFEADAQIGSQMLDRIGLKLRLLPNPVPYTWSEGYHLQSFVHRNIDPGIYAKLIAKLRQYKRMK